MVGKRKRGGWETLEERLAKLFCYYCDREFNDVKELTDHQKAKHFKCSQCNRRLNTVNGLYVHLEQVHKIKLTEVPNCTIESRNVVTRDNEIFGMLGVPEALLKARIAEITEHYYIEEAEYRAKTGNSLEKSKNDGEGDPEAKRQKKEETVTKTVASAKEQIARRRAEKAAAAAGQAIPQSASPGATSNTPEQNTVAFSPPTAVHAPVTMESSHPPTNQYGNQVHAPVYPNGQVPMQAPAPMSLHHNNPSNGAFPHSTFNHHHGSMPQMHGQPHTSALPPTQHHGLPARPQTLLPVGPQSRLQTHVQEAYPTYLPNPTHSVRNGGLSALPQQPSSNGQSISAKQSVAGTSTGTTNVESVAGPEHTYGARKWVVGSIPDKEAALKAISIDLESAHAYLYTEPFLADLGERLGVKLSAKPEAKVTQHNPAPPAGMVIKNNVVSWEERRAQGSRYQLPVSTIS